MQWRWLPVKLLGVLTAGWLSGCAALSPPDQLTVSDPIGERIAEEHTAAADPGRRALEVVRQLLGTPYVFGGDSPSGFDCSGLVHYAYRQVGVELPRTSREQFRTLHRVDLDRLQSGDLLFFRVARQRVDHVGIFAEADRFIHAPSAGKNVSYARLTDPFWRSRLVGAGRVFTVAFADGDPATAEQN